MVSLHKEEGLMEDERNNEAQRPHTRQNPKRYISLVSLSLWHKVVAICCFVWALGGQVVSEWVRQNFKF